MRLCLQALEQLAKCRDKFCKCQEAQVAALVQAGKTGRASVVRVRLEPLQSTTQFMRPSADNSTQRCMHVFVTSACGLAHAAPSRRQRQLFQMRRLCGELLTIEHMLELAINVN